MYTLDFETMKQVMQVHQKTGFLTAETPSGVRNLRGPCRIEISLQAGSIGSCMIVSSNGKRLEGKDAEQAIARLGSLRWTFTPPSEVASRAVQVVIEEKMLCPQRTTWIRQEQTRAWPRIHRAVFALADGTKSVQKIAHILSTSPYVVNGVLRDLDSIGVITMVPQRRQDHSNSW